MRKLVLSLVIAAALTPMSTPVMAEDDPTFCLLTAGCIWTGTYWYCPDPDSYANCVE